jgi:hypothetical protein
MAERILEWFGENVLPWFIIFLIACGAILILWLPFAIYQEHYAEKFSLIKAEWNCIGYRTHSTSVLVGKVIVPINENECIQWVKK